MRRSAVVLLTLACACGGTASRADAPGTYVLHLRGAADTLWVRPDGSYTRLRAVDGAAPFVVAGTWEFEELSAGPAVMFSGLPFRAPYPPAPNVSPRSVWPSLIQRTATGTVVLPVQYDGGARYHRISNGMLGSGGRR
jgi:hypothetical protein